MDFGESDISRSTGKENEGECGTCLVHQAAAQGDIDLLVKVVREDPSMLELQDSDGFTPLSLAVHNKQLRGVKRLVKMGANINAQDNLGRTCLSIAAYQGWHEGVVYLLRNGSKKNISDKHGRTALHAATYDTDRRALTVLLQSVGKQEIDQADNEHMTALHWAAFHDRPTHLQDIIDRGADITAQDIDGKTALHWASQNGSKKCCEILVSSLGGLELLNSADITGKTPVHFAAAAGHSDILQLLSSFPECDPEVLDPDDRSPLHWAAATGKSECLKILLSLSVAPNQPDAEGGTPLDYARQSEHTDCVSLLVKKLGRKFDKQDSQTSIAGTTKENKGPIGFLRNLLTRKKSGDEVGRNSPKKSTEEIERRKSTDSQTPDAASQKDVPPAGDLDSNETRNQPGLTPVPTILVESPSHFKTSPAQPQTRKRSLKKQKRTVIPDGEGTRSESVIPSGDTGMDKSLEVNPGERLRKRSVSPRSLSPLQSRKIISNDEEQLESKTTRSRSARRTKGLQPLPDRPSLHPPEGSTQPTSPPVSPRLLPAFEVMDSPVSPREGSLAPLRGLKPRQDILANSRVTVLQKERTGANRTPTPPPSDVDSKILKLHTGLSPLSPLKIDSKTHNRKTRRSLILETEMEMNSIPIARQKSVERSEKKHCGEISPLAVKELSMSSLRKQYRDLGGLQNHEPAGPKDHSDA